MKAIIRLVVKSVAGLAILAILVYLLLLLINLNDAEPTELTQQFRNSYASYPVPADSDNAFLSILGFSALPDDDPLTMGVARRDWMLSNDWKSRTTDDPLLMDYEPRARRSESVTNLAEACKDPGLACIASLDADSRTLEEWLKSEDWLRRRYVDLLAMPAFFEMNSFDVAAPLPSYHVVLEGQKLLFLDSLLSARSGDMEAVRQFLEKDLAFWRSVLSQSDLLITKMIATAAVAKHFKFGNLLFRELHGQGTSVSLPAVWLQPITLEERTMRRCFVGEWLFSESIINDYRNSKIYPLSDSFYADEQSLADAVAWRLIKPFWQPQDSSNRYAGLLADMSDSLDAPLENLPEALPEAVAAAEMAFKPRSRLYNITGDYLFAGSGTTMPSYSARVADLEGIRRAAVILAELRSESVGVEEVPDIVSSNPITDPYKALPFEWEIGRKAIVFEGLEERERGTHRLPY